MTGRAVREGEEVTMYLCRDNNGLWVSVERNPQHLGDRRTSPRDLLRGYVQIPRSPYSKVENVGSLDPSGPLRLKSPVVLPGEGSSCGGLVTVGKTKPLKGPFVDSEQ